MKDNFLNNNFEKATDSTSENNKKNNISKSSAIFDSVNFFRGNFKKIFNPSKLFYK